MRSKQVLGNIALGFASVLVALIIGEVSLRLLFAEHINLFPRYTASAHYGEFTIRRLQPNSSFWHTSVDGSWKFVTNSKGFRNESNFSYEKSPGVFRVLSLGDSNTQGMEVQQDQTFSAITERFLRGEGVDVEVINSGVSGFSTAEAVVFLENEGIKYHPDVVVLGFYANDMADNIKSGIFAVTEEGLMVKKKTHIPGVNALYFINKFALLRWLSEHSYAYSFAFNSIWTYAKQLLYGKEKARLTTEYAIPVNQVNEYELELMTKLIERLYAFCQQHNVRLVILDIPIASKKGQVLSSVPPDLYETMKSNSDFFIHSKDALNKYRNVAEIHVPHGNRHISKFTHLVYGMEVVRAISGVSKWETRASE